MATKITCVIVDDEPVARDILTSFVAKIPNFILLKSCQNAMEAFEILNTQSVDLFFLDINMPEISGLTLAKSMPKKTKIIFTTAYREYAVNGFDLHAIDYLLKPIAFDRFLQSVNRFFEIATPLVSPKIKEKERIKNDFIFVRSDRKMVQIKFKEVLYIESLSDYLSIVTKAKTIITRETISNIEAKLPKTSFLRIHRSYIVNISKIILYTNEFVEIEKKALPISRSYKENVLQQLAEI